MNEPVNILQKFRIGAFDQRVQILAPTEAAGTNGEITQTWGEYATRYADVQPMGGSEPVLGDMIQPFSRARFIFRYDTNITEKYRLVWNAHTYNIISINVIPRNRFLEIIAESYSITDAVAVDYGDYYSKNSLKIRVVTASAVTTITPTQAQLTSDIGITPAAAGAGYICFLYIASLVKYLMVTSNGSHWFYSYVTT